MSLFQVNLQFVLHYFNLLNHLVLRRVMDLGLGFIFPRKFLNETNANAVTYQKLKAHPWSEHDYWIVATKNLGVIYSFSS